MTRFSIRVITQKIKDHHADELIVQVCSTINERKIVLPVVVDIPLQRSHDSWSVMRNHGRRHDVPAQILTENESRALSFIQTRWKSPQGLLACFRFVHGPRIITFQFEINYESDIARLD